MTQLSQCSFCQELYPQTCIVCKYKCIETASLMYQQNIQQRHLNRPNSKNIIKLLDTHQNIPPVIGTVIVSYSLNLCTYHDYQLNLDEIINIEQKFITEIIPEISTMTNWIKWAESNEKELKHGDIILFHEPFWIFDDYEGCPVYVDNAEEMGYDEFSRWKKPRIWVFCLDSKTNQIVECGEPQSSRKCVIPASITKYLDDPITFYQFYHPQRNTLHSMLNGWEGSIENIGISLKWNNDYIAQICQYEKYKQLFNILHPKDLYFELYDHYLNIMKDRDDIHKTWRRQSEIPYGCSWKTSVIDYKHHKKLKQKALKQQRIEIKLRVILRNENKTKFHFLPYKWQNLPQIFGIDCWRARNTICRPVPAGLFDDDNTLMIMDGPIIEQNDFKQCIMDLSDTQWFPYDDSCTPDNWMEICMKWFDKEKWLIMIAYQDDNNKKINQIFENIEIIEKTLKSKSV